MNNLIKQLNMIRNWIVMRKSRKEEIRNMLITRMTRGHSSSPARAGAFGHLFLVERSKDVIHVLAPYFSIKPMQFIALLTALSLIGGGTSYAAEGTLPGDPLYPIKIRVNEEVVAALSFSDEAKANWETARAERRLEETATLAAENKLTTNTETSLKTSFETHAERVRGYINRMEKNGNTDAAISAASHLESSLQAYESIVAGINPEEAGAPGTETIGSIVSNTLQDTTKTREALEEKVVGQNGGPEIQTAAEGKITAATNVLQSVHFYLEKKKMLSGSEATDTANAIADAETQINDAAGILSDAESKRDTQDYKNAFLRANQALRTAEEAKQLLHARADLKLSAQKKEERKETQEGNGNDTTGAMMPPEATPTITPSASGTSTAPIEINLPGRGRESDDGYENDDAHGEIDN